MSFINEDHLKHTAHDITLFILKTGKNCRTGLPGRLLLKT